jgi:hypothetical protein
MRLKVDKIVFKKIHEIQRQIRQTPYVIEKRSQSREALICNFREAIFKKSHRYRKRRLHQRKK